MEKFTKVICVLSLFGLLAIGIGSSAWAADKQASLDQRFLDSKAIFNELIEQTGVPKKIVDNTECIAVIPNVAKMALIIGGQSGDGIVTCRGNDKAWGAPGFVSVSKASVGAQVGAESTNLVMFVVGNEAAKAFTKSKFTLGADVKVQAGPAGKGMSANTDDLKVEPGVYTYAVGTKGLFAGVSFEGGKISFDEKATEQFYGKTISSEELLFSNVAPENKADVSAFLASLPTLEKHAS